MPKKRTSETADTPQKPTTKKSSPRQTPRQETPRQSRRSRGARAIGISGFDFGALNQRFRATAGNEASNYGVTIQPAEVAPGTRYWKAIGVYHLSPDENRGRHNIFVDVLNDGGQRAKEMTIGWTWDGNSDPHSLNHLDKPDNEPATDIPIFGSVFRLWVAGGEASDIVSGIHAQHADEHNAAGELLNSIGHHSFYVVFQRVQKAGSTGVTTGGGGNVITPPVTPVEKLPTLGAKLASAVQRAANKIGIDANAPIDERTGQIGAQVTDPSIIAGMGVGWVRLNFIIGPWQNPHDTHRPFGKSWQESYQTIIDGFASRGLRIYGLISDQALGNKPGGSLRSAPEGDLRGDAWIQSYANTFVTIVRMFGNKVALFESFNEPDDWKKDEQPGWSDGTPNWIHPGWFATILQAVHQAVRSDPSLAHVRLVSGPLQGFDVNMNAGVDYLRRTYEEGKFRYRWGEPGVPFPFDGVGYHLYIAEGERENVGQRLRDKYNHYMNELRSVITSAEGALKPIFISEFGWANDGSLDHLQPDAMNSALDAILNDASVALGIWFCTQDFPNKPYGLYRQGALSVDQRKAVHGKLQAICNQEMTLTTLETIGSRVAEQVTSAAAQAATSQTTPNTLATQWIGVVTTGQLNVRSGPGVEHAQVGSLLANNPVEVIEQIGDWLRIQWQGSTAFVNAKFVEHKNKVLETWNRYRILLEQESARLGIDPTIAVAILMAEAGGSAFAADGRMIIRFENHIFYDQWGRQNEATFRQHFTFDANRSWEGHAWRADVNSEWQPCHQNQQGEWLLFDFARKLAANAAMMSISMGAPQIMGFNYPAVGYVSVQAMFDAFQADDDNQVLALFRFIENKQLVDAIRQGDLRRFAAGYNGSGQTELYAGIIQKHLDNFRSASASSSRAMATPSDRSPRATLNFSEDWNRRLLLGLDKSRQLLEAAIDAFSVHSVDDALVAAQLGITLHTYWAQLSWLENLAAAQDVLQRATDDALHRLRELSASNRGGDVDPAGNASITQPTGTSPATANATRRRALCIGIDEYTKNPLSGCVADAKLWATTLVNLGFETPQLLLNQEATRSAILDAVNKLVTESQLGDVIVIQYAGHGTQLPDVSGDENGGATPNKDEAIVPFDFLSGAYLLDDELGAIFTRIPAGVNVTCFMDCCHSGSISRAERLPDENPRLLVVDDPDMVAAYRQYRKLIGGSRAGGKRDVESMAEVVFSACQSEELAWESNGHGKFTLRTTALLKKSAGTTSHEAFMQAISEAFRPEASNVERRQTPLLECASAGRGRVLLKAVA